MVQFDYAECSDGEIIHAADIVAGDRQKYTCLICPACRQPMTAAVGQVVESHFRHRVGEQCSDYFAKVIEKTIVYSYEQCQTNNLPYELLLPKEQVINLAKSGAALERYKVNNDCRVDLRFRSGAGQIEIVVSRRETDMHMLERMEGNCIGIDAQSAQVHGVKNLVQLFNSGIDTNLPFVKFFRKGQEVVVAPLQRRVPQLTKNVKIPFEKQPGESTEDYRFRILGRRS